MTGDERPLAIVAALPEEVRALVRRLEAGRRLASGLVAGCLGGRSVVVGPTGDGAAAARRGVEHILSVHLPVAVLGIGFAGGLDPALGRGALVVGREVEALSPGRLAADAGWAERTARRLEAPAGLLLTHEALVATPEAKAAIRARRPEALAVDLESAVWAAAAHERRVPWLVVRIVFDTARERLPPAVVAAAGPDGRIRRGRLVRRALLRPRRLRALLRMGREASRLADRLADAAVHAAAAL